VGETYNDIERASAIRALFGLGLFKDVRLEVVGDVLVVIVEENAPRLPTLILLGRRSSTRMSSKKALREVDSLKANPLTKRLLTRQTGLKRQLHQPQHVWRRDGFITVTPIRRNRVEFVFQRGLAGEITAKMGHTYRQGQGFGRSTFTRGILTPGLQRSDETGHTQGQPLPKY
jgi:outer membrane protein assembly factor BamA